MPGSYSRLFLIKSLRCKVVTPPRLQGIGYDKFVELDHDEVTMRKARAISRQAALREPLEAGNADMQISEGQGTVLSAEYCLLGADLRDPARVRFWRPGCCFECVSEGAVLLGECCLLGADQRGAGHCPLRRVLPAWGRSA